MAQEDLRKKVDLAFLAAFYGGMLTENQRRVLSLHCEEDLSLGEIAEEVGYADSMSFSKAFKKRFHLTPSEFRNSKTNFVSKREKGEFTEGLL